MDRSIAIGTSEYLASSVYRMNGCDGEARAQAMLMEP